MHHRIIKTAAVLTAGVTALALGVAGCTYDDHELKFDKLTCRTADHSLHAVQVLATRRGQPAGSITITGVRSDSTVKKTTTYAALTAAETRSSHWHGPYATGRNGNFTIKGIGSIMLNTWVETTHGNCLATGTVYWEAHISAA